MENREQAISNAIKEILIAYGESVINDVQRMNALLMDYIPGRSRERKLIISALEENVSSELLQHIEKNEEGRRLCFSKCVRRLVSELWITEEAAQFAVRVIAVAIGFDAELLPNTNVQTETNCRKELKKGVYPIDADMTTVLNGYDVIGYKAFAANLSLIELVIPSSIKIIKPKAFINCTKLKRVVLPPSIEQMGTGAFVGCDALESVDFGRNPKYGFLAGLIIDKKDRALIRATKKVTPVCVIPSEIELIHDYAFERSDIQEIDLPRGLPLFSANSIHLCNHLRCFKIDRENAYFSVVDGVLHSKDCSVLIRFPPGYVGTSYIVEDTVSHIGVGAFSGTVNLETITFTSSLKTIGPRAFELCPKLSSIILPNSVENIGERAFQYCDNLATVMLPKSIREIGDFAFCGCTSIETISIPRDVKRIGNSAFKDCSNLKKVIIQDGVSFIGDGTFAGCTEGLTIAVKNNPYAKAYCNAQKIAWSEL